MRPTLVFVYNAESGLFNTVTDIAHKVFSPETYSCHLCALTYGTFTIRAEWKAFLESLAVDLEFLHRDELAARYGVKEALLPAIYRKEDGVLLPFATAEAINACADLAALKALIVTRLGGRNGDPA